METEGRECGSPKPCHVKKLNFGHSILTLNTVNQFGGQKGSRLLLIDSNVTRIPCTDRAEFVRKWIETHGEHGFDFTEERSGSCSPILSKCTTKRAERSPILGNRRKRARGKASLNNNAINNTEPIRLDNVGEKPVQAWDPKNLVAENDKSVNNNDAAKENLEKTPFNYQYSPKRIIVPNVVSSPILDRNSPLYKKRHKKFGKNKTSREALTSIENNSTDTNMNSVLSGSEDKESPKQYSIVSSQKQRKLIEKLRANFDKKILETQEVKDRNPGPDSATSGSPLTNAKLNIQESIRGIESTVFSCSPRSEVNISIEDSPKGTKGYGIIRPCVLGNKLNIEDSPVNMKDTVKVEIESSNENDDNHYRDIVNIYSDSETSPCDLIEEVDTQDTNPVVKKHSCIRTLSFDAIKSTSARSQESSQDSDKTFFSKAVYTEALRTNLSEKISEYSSQIVANSKASEIDIISTETSPPRVHIDPTMSLAVLDSGKKRRKPKKGSLSEKLQSLVSRQISSVRIWRHQIKQAIKDNASVPSVTVYAQKCTSRFGRQFLEGTLVEDPFNFLTNKGSPSRSITIMTIPAIAGRLEMKSQSLVQICPPWEVLDEKNLLLNVTYMNILSNEEKIHIENNRAANVGTKETIIQEFNCPCMDADRVLPTCPERLRKPDVMESIFKRKEPDTEKL